MEAMIVMETQRKHILVMKDTVEVSRKIDRLGEKKNRQIRGKIDRLWRKKNRLGKKKTNQGKRKIDRLGKKKNSRYVGFQL